MLGLAIDWGDLQRMATSVGASADQIPYAVAIALNRSADITRTLLIRHTWPGHVKQRNASFIAAALTTRDARASKYSLSVEIYDRLGRANLYAHAKGGTRTPRGGGKLAIPSRNIPRTGRGVPVRLRPKNIKNAIKTENAIFMRDGKGRLKLAYVLKPATKIPRRVPFYEDFEASMRRELHRTIPLAVARAMATRR